MVEKIENKLTEYIEYLLTKDHLDYPDYLILTSELNRVSVRENKFDWGKNFAQLVTLGFGSPTDIKEE